MSIIRRERPRRMIGLESSDGVFIEVEEAIAAKSVLILDMMEAGTDCSKILFTNITSKILNKVIEYCRRYVEAQPEKCPYRSDKASTDPFGPSSKLIIEYIIEVTGGSSAVASRNRMRGTIEEFDDAFMKELDQADLRDLMMCHEEGFIDMDL
ncbi:hypothetical protein OROMI_009803 [Orobanche minor]